MNWTFFGYSFGAECDVTVRPLPHNSSNFIRVRKVCVSFANNKVRNSVLLFLYSLLCYSIIMKLVARTRVIMFINVK